MGGAVYYPAVGDGLWMQRDDGGTQNRAVGWPRIPAGWNGTSAWDFDYAVIEFLDPGPYAELR